MLHRVSEHLARMARDERHSRMTALPRIRRAHTIAVAALVATTLALTACSSGDSGPTENESGQTSSSNYPVTVDSAYGALTLDDKPERILVMSPSYVDMLTAIDIQPVAFATGSIPAADFDSNYPWLEGRYDGAVAADLVTADFKPSLEVIASYQPDLILAHTWSVSDDLYAGISQIAPTYVSSDDGSAATQWTVDMKAIGALTQHADAAETALADFDSVVEQYKDQLANLQNKTYNSIAVRDAGYQFGSGGWLSLMGLQPADTQGTYTDAPLSPENMDQLSADVLLAYTFSDSDRAKFEGDGRFADLPAAKNGTALFGDPAMANAATFPAPAALKYLMDRTVPILETSALNQEN
ncbi:ABC transporter substrate-binding protein [Rhodococcus fascians]|nr:ABC transporter substrate-binding protein [Rhodococcus fascians]MBY3998133.1 ABC transporter substrate-binding protein [Rhodococcus fascians]MBY4004481.1 ABC transporter substrate-binding protein [Rhodococcus fascians]MBY4008946.1 ABC transporter substrate-binding protein [Rhodococcus fascians]MBY4019688.1 ABC transporter substrate-binding protein [Rhodococcus fascians]